MSRIFDVTSFFGSRIGLRDRHGGSLRIFCQGRSVEWRAAKGGARKKPKALVPGLVLFLALVPGVASSQWTQVGQDIDGVSEGEWSGRSVALSADGSRVAIGATEAEGYDVQSGHVRVYQYQGIPHNDWLQVGVDIDGEAAGDSSGTSVAISSGGTWVAIGAPANDDNGSYSGQVRVYSTEVIFVDGFESGNTSAW